MALGAAEVSPWLPSELITSAFPCERGHGSALRIREKLKEHIRQVDQRVGGSDSLMIWFMTVLVSGSICSISVVLNS